MASSTPVIMNEMQILWDIDYCEDSQGPVIPFKYFVTPQGPQAQTHSWSFTRLLDLPADVVLRIFQFCDASTLFHFMRTCTSFRYMTLKLFWSDPTIWYHVHYYDWWNAIKSNLPGRIDTEFARQATQVEIDMGPLEREFAVQDRDRNDWYGLERSKRINFFWLAVQHSFPSARRIVLGSICPRFNKDSKADGIVALLLRQARRDMHVFVAAKQSLASQAERTLWSIDTSTTPQLRAVTTSWLPKRVKMPVRLLSKGPLRDFKLMNRIQNLLWLEQNGLDRLIEKSHTYYPDGKEVRPERLYVYCHLNQ